ncbi:MAG: hypothetical protein QM499_03120 [Flavobacteriaceae bacterium]
MKIEDSRFINLEHEEITLPFGNFYFFEKFVVSELNEGVHFDWKRVKILSDIMTNHYGEVNNLIYLSNRVNSYSIEPQSWLKFDSKYHLFKASGIIAYDNRGGLSVVLERLFSKERIKRFRRLKDAIEWALKQDL